MGMCQHRDSVSGEICSHLISSFCSNKNTSFYRCPEYIASLNINNFNISHSQIRSWDRCPRKWAYEQILGLQVREPMQSIAMRMGRELQRILSKSPGPPTYFSPSEAINVEMINIILTYIEEREMINGIQWELELDREGFHGIIDVVFNEETFGEIKFSGSPDFYLNNSIAWDQLEGYFFLNPKFKWGIMLPIRMPQLKDKMDEDEESKIVRIKADIAKKFNHYFPHFDPKRKNPRWGRPFSVNEVDKEEFKEKFQWTKKEIQTACIADYFTHRRSNCLSPGLCDFIPLCEGRNINWEIYERRKDPYKEAEL